MPEERLADAFDAGGGQLGVGEVVKIHTALLVTLIVEEEERTARLRGPCGHYYCHVPSL